MLGKCVLVKLVVFWVLMSMSGLVFIIFVNLIGDMRIFLCMVDFIV